jgi:hypothetical protein
MCPSPFFVLIAPDFFDLPTIYLQVEVVAGRVGF